MASALKPGIGGMLFAHTLAYDFALRHTGYALGRWWEHQHPTVSELCPNRKWESYFRGGWPKEPLLSSLVDMDKNLAEVVSNPLVHMLTGSGVAGRAERWHYFLHGLRVDARYAFPYSTKLMQDICGRPHWSRLYALLSILSSQEPLYALQKVWVQRNIFCYILLACVLPAFWYVREEFYESLNRARLADGYLMGEVFGWPSNYGDFDMSVQLMRIYLMQLMGLRSTTASAEDLLLLMWIMFSDPRTIANWAAHHYRVEGINPTASMLASWRASRGAQAKLTIVHVLNS